MMVYDELAGERSVCELESGEPFFYDTKSDLWGYYIKTNIFDNQWCTCTRLTDGRSYELARGAFVKPVNAVVKVEGFNG